MGDYYGCADLLKKLQYVGVLNFATVDKYGKSQIRNISAIHYEQRSMYFFTARGKAFCEELLSDGNVQILGYTKYKEMIRLSAKVEKVSDREQKKWIDIIFDEQPYLSNVYPDDTREIGIVFCTKNAEIEYFNLGVNPIFRESYIVGKADITEKGIVKISDLQPIQKGIYLWQGDISPAWNLLKNDCGSIAFCCISTGVFHFPNKKAAKIAVRTVKEYREKMRNKMEVVFNVFQNDDYEIYCSFPE